MTIKDTAVTAFVMGLLTGMIVAFASCSVDAPEAPTPRTGQSALYH